jgi:hypothetical protein
VSGVALIGLRAENPLAFLAALGVLSLVSGAGNSDPHVAVRGTPRLGWRRCDGTWVPYLLGAGLETQAEVLDAIAHAHTQRDLVGELGWAKDIMRVSRSEMRELLATRATNPRAARVLAACLAELPPRRRDSSASYTPFRLIPRAGRARFLDAALRESRSGIHHLRTCLFETWAYSSEVQSLRWDPGARVASRALMAEAPTHVGTSGVDGAVLLAVAGLTCFPLMITRRGAVPPGLAFANRFVWPIWNEPLELALVQMLLSMRWLHQLDHNDRRAREHAVRQLSSHGVAARFAAARVRRGVDDQAFGWGTPTVLDTSDEHLRSIAH